MTTDYGKAGAELVEKIASELGPDWLELPGIGGTEKSIVIWDDDHVALVAGDAAFYLLGGPLWSRVRADGNIVTGRWIDGELEVVGLAPVPDPNLN